jgi:hypothetical protein
MSNSDPTSIEFGMTVQLGLGGSENKYALKKEVGGGTGFLHSPELENRGKVFIKFPRNL